MPQYRISVLPTPGAITTIKGYATGEYDGMYGSDIGFHELATDTNRFKGFKARIKRQPMQSFWSNTIEVSLAVHARNKDKIKKWTDLGGKRVFTGTVAVRRARPSRTRAWPRSTSSSPMCRSTWRRRDRSSNPARSTP